MMKFRYIFSALLVSSLAYADDVASDEAKIMAEPSGDVVADKPETKASAGEEPVDISVGTKLYDAETVKDLFKTYDEENKRLAAENDAIMSESGNVLELRRMEVRANDLRDLRELSNKIDPQPRRRLNRLAELDPEAAADLQVSMRAEERFFAGEMDPTNDMNAGRTANVDFRKIGTSLDNALERVRQALKPKKVTDDQESVETGE